MVVNFIYAVNSKKYNEKIPNYLNDWIASRIQGRCKNNVTYNILVLLFKT